jgi:hypothetical protein
MGTPPLKHARRPSRIATDESGDDAWVVMDRHATFPHRLLRLATLQVRVWNLFERLLRSTINGNQDYEPNHSAPLSVPQRILDDSLFGVCPISNTEQPAWQMHHAVFPHPGELSRYRAASLSVTPTARLSPTCTDETTPLKHSKRRPSRPMRPGPVAVNIARLPELLKQAKRG